MSIEQKPWLTPKKFWLFVALFVVVALANCVGRENNASGNVAIATGLSAESRQTLAAMINLSGQLCANVTDVSQLGNDRYTVACTRYKDGTGSATYEVDLRTGSVK